MTRIIVVSPQKMAVILAKLGFVLIRQRGSHAYFRHADGRSAVVPMHTGEDLGKGLVREILRSIDLTVDEYDKLRRQI